MQITSVSIACNPCAIVWCFGRSDHSLRRPALFSVAADTDI